MPLWKIDYSAAPRYTYPHELAHLQGAGHHVNDGIGGVDPNLVFADGHGYRFTWKPFLQTTERRATIMAFPRYFLDEYPRIKYLSTPDATFSGQAVGQTTTFNNAKIVKQTAVPISDYRDPNELRTSVTYNLSGQNDYTFIAQPCGGSAPLTYEWRKSYASSGYYGSVQSTQSTWNPALTNGTWYIQLTAKAGPGQVAESVVSVHVESGGGCTGPGCNAKEVSVGQESPTHTGLTGAYPNPFNPTTQITYQLHQSQQVTVTVFDMTGRMVQVMEEGRKNAGTYNLSFDASALSSGVYLVTLQTETNLYTQKITLIK